jgi:spore coat protein CotH
MTLRSFMKKPFHAAWILVMTWVWLGAQTPSPQGAPGAVHARVASNLPIVYLDSTSPIVSELKNPCFVRLAAPAGANPGETGRLAGVARIHGASSQMYPKKSFAITLEKPVGLLGMRETAHWVLNAAYVDRSMMRHKLSYDLFRALSGPDGKRYAAASRFVEVYRNGKYHGAYLLIERVDAAMLELQRFQTNDLSHAVIYKAIDHGADFSRPDHAAYEQREPDPLVKVYWKPLDQFNRFVSGAADGDFFHPTRGISTRLDIGNTIDFHLLLLLTSNMDGYDKNLIIVRDAPKTNAPLQRFFFVPWDYDATFGRNWNALPVETTAWLSNYLLERLLEDPEYRQRFAARWRQLREREFSVKQILRMIDDNARTLGDAVRRNEARWNTLHGQYPDQLSFREDIAEMKEWVDARVRWLDREIARRTSVP